MGGCAFCLYADTQSISALCFSYIAMKSESGGKQMNGIGERKGVNGFSRGDLHKGLTDSEVAASRAAHGDNGLRAHKGKSFGARFLANLGDPVIKILLCALAVNVLFLFRNANWFETGGIAVSVFLATLISTLSEYGSEAAFRRLSEACGRQFCRVFRNGDVCEIPMAEVVVGDLVSLCAGEQIPADGVLVRGRISVDQSAMTGEGREVEKCPLSRDQHERLPSSQNAVFRGCTVLSGEGEMAVERVGDATFLGEISKEVQMDTRESPLRIRLGKLARQISRLGYCAAILVAVVFLINAFVLDSGFDRTVIMEKLTDLPYVVGTLLHAFMLGLTVVVMAVPEGLPLMVAVVLSSNIRRMMRDHVLVRKPVGIEAAGSMNILFTDKTGTLTEGVLSVGKICTGDGKCFPDVAAFSAGGGACFTSYRESCMLNTAAQPGKNAAGNICALGGNATDRALLASVLPAVGEKTDGGAGYALAKIPFDSAKKFSAAQTAEGKVWLKGAPDLLLPHIRYRMDSNGARIRCGGNEAERILRRMLKNGERVLLVAMSEGGMQTLRGGTFGALTLICFVTLEDRLRPEAPGAVRSLRDAGIHVVMMTGDSRETAGNIATRCGILGDGVDMVLDSAELATLSDSRLRVILPRIGVIARALPTDKSRLVRIAQEADLVVGMTGDGINDAPALRRADIGFSMGDGTQVAKDAGDIIILDNNIGSIVKAVLYGRNIFKSIRKFIVLQLMMNFCAVGVSMICPFLGIDAPVTVVQMLWINIIMDTLGGLAFAGEAPPASCMREKPKRRDQAILNRYMINEIVFHGSFTVAMYLVFLKCPFFIRQFRQAPDNIYLMTAFFALFIFSSVFNCFNARTDRLRLLSGIEENKPFVGIMTAILLIQLVFVYVGGAVLRTAPLTLRELGVTALCALSVFPAEFLRKLLWRARGKTERY